MLKKILTILFFSLLFWSNSTSVGAMGENEFVNWARGLKESTEFKQREDKRYEYYFKLDYQNNEIMLIIVPKEIGVNYKDFQGQGHEAFLKKYVVDELIELENSGEDLIHYITENTPQDEVLSVYVATNASSNNTYVGPLFKFLNGAKISDDLIILEDELYPERELLERLEGLIMNVGIEDGNNTFTLDYKDNIFNLVIRPIQIELDTPIDETPKDYQISQFLSQIRTQNLYDDLAKMIEEKMPNHQLRVYYSILENTYLLFTYQQNTLIEDRTIDYLAIRDQIYDEQIHPVTAIGQIISHPKMKKLQKKVELLGKYNAESQTFWIEVRPNDYQREENNHPVNFEELDDLTYLFEKNHLDYDRIYDQLYRLVQEDPKLPNNVNYQMFDSEVYLSQSNGQVEDKRPEFKERYIFKLIEQAVTVEFEHPDKITRHLIKNESGGNHKLILDISDFSNYLFGTELDEAIREYSMAENLAQLIESVGDAKEQLKKLAKQKKIPTDVIDVYWLNDSIFLGDINFKVKNLNPKPYTVGNIVNKLNKHMEQFNFLKLSLPENSTNYEIKFMEHQGNILMSTNALLLFGEIFSDSINTGMKEESLGEGIKEGAKSATLPLLVEFYNLSRKEIKDLDKMLKQIKRMGIEIKK